MLKKIAAFLNHPYMGPLTETVKGIGSIARAPVASFIEDAINGWQEGADAGDGSARIKSMYAALFESFNPGTGLIAIAGSFLSAIGLAFGVAVVMGGSGTGMLVAAELMAFGFGAAAGPFVLAGAIAAAAAAVGTVIGGVPGFIKGISKIVDYHRDRKGYEAAMQKLAGQPQAEDNAKAFAPILGRFNELSQDKREAFVRLMNKEYERTIWDDGEKIVKSIEALPAWSRQKLVERLKEDLAAEFADAAGEDLPDVKEAAAPAIKPDNGPMVAPAIASFRPRKRKMAAVP